MKGMPKLEDAAAKPPATFTKSRRVYLRVMLIPPGYSALAEHLVIRVEFYIFQTFPIVTVLNQQ
jgi:hypothetical protein